MKKKKLVAKALAYALSIGMLFSSVPMTPITVSAKTSYETNETIKPDGDTKTVYHDLDKITSKTWSFESEDPTKQSKMTWDLSNHVLTIQNIDLSVTNTNIKS